MPCIFEPTRLPLTSSPSPQYSGWPDRFLIPVRKRFLFHFSVLASRGGKSLAGTVNPTLSTVTPSVGALGCIRPGRYDTSVKPVPFFFFSHCFILLSPKWTFLDLLWLPLLAVTSLCSVIVFSWFHAPPSPLTTPPSLFLSTYFLSSLLSSPTADTPDRIWWWHFTHADPRLAHVGTIEQGPSPGLLLGGRGQQDGPSHHNH